MTVLWYLLAYWIVGILLVGRWVVRDRDFFVSFQTQHDLLEQVLFAVVIVVGFALVWPGLAYYWIKEWRMWKKWKPQQED